MCGKKTTDSDMQGGAEQSGSSNRGDKTTTPPSAALPARFFLRSPTAAHHIRRNPKRGASDGRRRVDGNERARVKVKERMKERVLWS